MGHAILTRRAGTLVKNIENAEVELDFSSIVYDTREHAPTVASVTLDGQKLRDLQDYYALVTPATDAGSYTILIHGVGEYGGVKAVPWRITQAQGSISVSPSSVTIQGAAGTTADVTITYTGDGEISVSSSQYVTAQIQGTKLTLTSKAEGSGSVTITLANGKNYKGASTQLSVNVYFIIPLESCSWEEIGQIAASGKAASTFALGDKKAFTINGETYNMQIVDFDHDDLDSTDTYYNSSNYNHGRNKAAITLCMEQIYSNMFAMDNNIYDTGQWNLSNGRKAAQSVRDLMEDDLRNRLRTVRKTYNFYISNSNKYSFGESADNVFLASQMEVTGKANSFQPGTDEEGTWYKYFKDGGTVIKKYKGSNYYWSLRSIDPSNLPNNYFMCITETGQCNGLRSYYKGGLVLFVCI